MHVGDFGAGHDPVAATFGWFGTTLRVHPDVSETVFLTLGGEMEGKGDFDAMRLIVENVVHPDDVTEFWRVARQNRQSFSDITKFALDLLAAVTDRPTGRPSESSDGPPPTGTTSEDGSSLPALRLLQGRPDLQVAVLQAQEARSA